MTLSISTGARNAAVDAVCSQLNVNGPGKINLYTGAKPATPSDGTSAGNTLLASFTLGNPAFAAALTGQANINAVASVTAVGTGTATWFRAQTANSSGVFDGSVGTSGAELNLSSTSVVTGGTVSITGGSVSMAG